MLGIIFNNTDYHYVLLEQRDVLLTRGAVIQTQFNSSALHGGMEEPASAGEGSGFTFKRKKINEDSIENKLFKIGNKSNSNKDGNATLAGYVRSNKTGEPVSGASVTADKPIINATTDQYGYFTVTIPKGYFVLNFQSFGMRDTRRRVLLNADGKLNIDMIDKVTSMKEVIVSAAKTANTRRVIMGADHLNIKSIKQMPAAFGEADILRALLTLPGVQTVGEASTGFNVRGGSADQNLILFNDATIFNPSHFFGFFSAFNPDVVKDVELFKSSIPAKYGGRLSSVLNITSREGNKKNITGTAGVGPLTSRFNIEGPIIKDKMSFIVGARTTYANWLLGILPDAYKNSRAGFYDVNAHLAYQVNNKNNIYVTGYLSSDRFKLNSDTSYGYNNKNISLKWKHSFSNKFNSEVTTGYDHYDYNTSSSKTAYSAYKLAFDISQLNSRADFTWFWSTRHTADFGVSYNRYTLHPGSYGPDDKQSLISNDEVAAEYGQESAIYLSDRWSLSPDLSINAGVRYSVFNYLGPSDVNMYAPGLPRVTENLIETKTFDQGKYIKTYSAPEYRLSARYNLTNDLSVKASFNTLHQYIHLLSNTTAISPTDIWKLSDPNIKPQYGEQVSLGVYKNFKSNTIETSIEVYHKNIRNYLDYKSGASLVMNHHIETDVMSTKGKAYGAEFMIKKPSGKLNGWISYTWSRILLKQNDPMVSEIINRGEYYPASYDKPNDVTLVGNYRFTHRLSVSLTSTYSTGRPITIPIGRLYYAGSQRTIFADRNAYRIPDYYRTDLSVNIEGNHKVHQKTHNSWTAGFYNLTGRKNPYSVYYVSEGGVINGYKLSIFGSIIPFINFNLRF